MLFLSADLRWPKQRNTRIANRVMHGAVVSERFAIALLNFFAAASRFAIGS